MVIAPTDQIKKLSAIPDEPQTSVEGLYFFLSLDLVNSTSYKTTHADWPVVMRQFYDIAKKEIRNKLDGTKVWKHVGDEVLFYKRIHSVDELEKATQGSFEALAASISVLANAFVTTRGKLSIKATAWIAWAAVIDERELEIARNKLSGDPNASLTHQNLVFSTYDEKSNVQMDFLGPDIDAGFRISKFAEKSVMVVSADLAYVLRKHGGAEITERMKIVQYAPLKGVWNDRLYPIVWYHDNWAKIADGFWYDDLLKPGLASDVLSNAKRDDIRSLEKVFADLQRDLRIARITEFLRSPPVEDQSLLEEAQAPRSLEVHCVALCFDSRGRVLIARRPQEKRIFPGKWEFGCAQLQVGQDFADAINYDYKADFRADIVMIRPNPILVYSVEKKNTKVPGLIFVAEIKNPETVQRDFNRTKHTEVKWVEIAEVKQMDSGSCVPDLITAAEAGFDVWQASRGA